MKINLILLLFVFSLNSKAQSFTELNKTNICQFINEYGFDSTYNYINKLKIPKDSANSLKIYSILLMFEGQLEISLSNKKIKKILRKYKNTDPIIAHRIKTWYYYNRKNNIRKTIFSAIETANMLEKKDNKNENLIKYYYDFANLLDITYYNNDFYENYLAISDITSPEIIFGESTLLNYWLNCSYYLSINNELFYDYDQLYTICLKNAKELENLLVENQEINVFLFQVYASIYANHLENNSDYGEKFINIFEKIQPVWKDKMLNSNVLICINKILSKDNNLKIRLQKLPYKKIIEEKYGIKNENVIDWEIIYKIKQHETIETYFNSIE